MKISLRLAEPIIFICRLRPSAYVTPPPSDVVLSNFLTSDDSTFRNVTKSKCQLILQLFLLSMLWRNVAFRLLARFLLD